MKTTNTDLLIERILLEEKTRMLREAYEVRDMSTIYELHNLENGSYPINEASALDWAKQKLGAAKQKAGELAGAAKEKIAGAKQSASAKYGAAKEKASDYLKGIKDIGLGTGTTLLGGEETLSYKQRQEKLKQAKDKVEGGLGKLAASENPLAVGLVQLYKNLEGSKFPNQDRAGFDQNIQAINAEYKKLVDAFNKTGKTKEDAAATNVLIGALRAIVIYYQDYRIADKYFYLKEADEFGAKEGEGAANLAAYSAKLPAGLAIAGLSLVGLGFGADSKAFQDALLSLRDMSQATDPNQIATGISNHFVKQIDVAKGKGITQAINALHGFKEGDPGFLGPNAPMSELMKYKEDLQALKGALIDPAGGTPIIDKIINGEIPGATKLAQFFKQTSNLSGKGGSLLAINPGSFGKTISKIVYKKVAAVAAQPLSTNKNKAIGYLSKLGGPVLKALGLGFLAGAGVSALMRAKGSKSSRMNDLRQVVIAMPDVKVGGGTQAVTPPKEVPPPPQPAGVQPQATPAATPQGAQPSATPAGAEPTTGPQGAKPTAPPIGTEPVATPKGTEPAPAPSAAGPEKTTGPTSPEGEKPKAPAGKGKLLVKPEDFMKGALAGEPGESTVEREVTNFYKGGLPDVPESDIKKVLGWLARNERLIAEQKKAMRLVISEAIGGMGTGERGRMKSQVGTDKLGKVGSEDKRGTSAEGIPKDIPAKIAKETKVDLKNVVKVLKLALKNEKFAFREEDTGKTYTQDELEKLTKDIKPPSLDASGDEWSNFFDTKEGEAWRNKHIKAGGTINNNTGKPVGGIVGDLKEHVEMRNRFMKLAGLLKG